MNHFLSLLLFVTAAHAGQKTSSVISLDPSLWQLKFSPGMASNPIGIGSRRAWTGWYFAFPQTDPNCADAQYCPSVHYVQTPFNNGSAMSGSISMTFTVQVTGGNPVFDWHTETGNTCTTPVHVRFILEQSNDYLCIGCAWPPVDTCDNCCQYWRWWSNPMAVEISAATGTATLTVSLSDLTQWSSVAGQRADASPCATAGFYQCLANIGQLGMTFSGGCFLGHGAFIDQGTGTANFVLTDFRLLP